MERHEHVGNYTKWFIGFRITNTQGINANKLTRSKATEGILLAAMNEESGGLRVVIRVEADESSSAVGKAIENIWTLLETEGMNESVEHIFLNVGGSTVDCWELYHELESLKNSFHDLGHST